MVIFGYLVMALLAGVILGAAAMRFHARRCFVEAIEEIGLCCHRSVCQGVWWVAVTVAGEPGNFFRLEGDGEFRPATEEEQWQQARVHEQALVESAPEPDSHKETVSKQS